MRSSGLPDCCVEPPKKTLWTRPEIEQKMQLLWNLSVCAFFGADPMPFYDVCYCIWMFCCNMWEKNVDLKKKNILKNPFKRQFMEKNKKKRPGGTRILLHLLGKQVFGWSSYFFQTPFVVYPASCLITALTCDCLFASVFFLHTPSPCAPFPPPRSTLQQL